MELTSFSLPTIIITLATVVACIVIVGKILSPTKVETKKKKQKEVSPKGKAEKKVEPTSNLNINTNLSRDNKAQSISRPSAKANHANQQQQRVVENNNLDLVTQLEIADAILGDDEPSYEPSPLRSEPSYESSPLRSEPSYESTSRNESYSEPVKSNYRDDTPSYQSSPSVYSGDSGGSSSCSSSSSCGD
ncbi:hypothetical protein OTK49_00740 [Vibrio coralliirubri]|uniref:hypothetical protein n=1 Tax=Vibrio coralliirubri TaxID=1516159 RepID=UPI002284EF36|nr:hypothetical protein [Vibrio coralliirubri]MCY9861061.1 hypothetical protein [Vibrio coralliirubri]